jgi:hypothetical protein
MKKPNFIKIAITAAGGRRTVSKKIKVAERTLSHWCAERKMPEDKIEPLCKMGGIVTFEQILGMWND